MPPTSSLSLAQARRLALARQLNHLAAWLGLARVQLNCTRADSERLRQALILADLSAAPA